MSVELYSLEPDPQYEGWRLQKFGSDDESYFPTKEEAMRRLPETVEHGGAVSIRDGDGHVEATVIIR